MLGICGIVLWVFFVRCISVWLLVVVLVIAGFVEV